MPPYLAWSRPCQGNGFSAGTGTSIVTPFPSRLDEELDEELYEELYEELCEGLDEALSLPGSVIGNCRMASSAAVASTSQLCSCTTAHPRKDSNEGRNCACCQA